MILIPSANVFLCKTFDERSRSTVAGGCTCRRRRRVRVLPKDLASSQIGGKELPLREKRLIIMNEILKDVSKN